MLTIFETSQSPLQESHFQAVPAWKEGGGKGEGEGGKWRGEGWLTIAGTLKSNAIATLHSTSR